MESIARERRATPRYNIELEVSYQTVDLERTIHTGEGATRNISSYGVLFNAGGELAPGAPVRLSIRWPVLMDGTHPMRLVVVGPVVRSSDNGVAVSIKNHGFVPEEIEYSSESETMKWWDRHLSRLRDLNRSPSQASVSVENSSKPVCR
jgi:hypothetical protein